MLSESELSEKVESHRATWAARVYECDELLSFTKHKFSRMHDFINKTWWVHILRHRTHTHTIQNRPPYCEQALHLHKYAVRSASYFSVYILLEWFNDKCGKHDLENIHLYRTSIVCALHSVYTLAYGSAYHTRLIIIILLHTQLTTYNLLHTIHARHPVCRIQDARTQCTCVRTAHVYVYFCRFISTVQSSQGADQ